MKKFTISLALVLVFIFNIVCFAGTATVRDFEFEYQWNLAVYNSKSTDEATYSEYMQPTSRIQSDNPDIISLANSIVQYIDDDYEKVRAIYNWVPDNIWYDWDCFEDKTKHGDSSALETLNNRRGVCAGYSNLTTALLRAIGIPALVAAGHASLEGRESDNFFDLSESFRYANHVWTESYVDGRWVIMDTTWASNNTFQRGTYSNQQASSQAYFDMSLRDLSKSYRYSPNYSIAPYSVIKFVIPYGVESIGDYAFWRCESLRDITLPDSVTFIGNAAFGYCTNLKDIIIPDSATSIGDFAFFRCTRLESIVIPDSVTEIGKYTFSGCTNLESVYIPDSVTSIGKNVFFDAPHVTIIGSAGSYAQIYAGLNSIPFKAGYSY